LFNKLINGHKYDPQRAYISMTTYDTKTILFKELTFTGQKDKINGWKVVLYSTSLI